MMKKESLKKVMSTFLCSVLVAAALITSGCSDSSQSSSSVASASESASVSESASSSESTAASDSQQTEDASESASSASQEATVMGEGETQFSFVVVDADGAETTFEIHTDETTVGAALLDLGLIEGEDREYGLYVKTVNGVTADYDVDGTYWAFYIDGEYASTGVDSTDINADSTYKMSVEKG